MQIARIAETASASGGGIEYARCTKDPTITPTAPPTQRQQRKNVLRQHRGAVSGSRLQIGKRALIRTESMDKMKPMRVPRLQVSVWRAKTQKNPGHYMFHARVVQCPLPARRGTRRPDGTNANERKGTTKPDVNAAGPRRVVPGHLGASRWLSHSKPSTARSRRFLELP